MRDLNFELTPGGRHLCTEFAGLHDISMIGSRSRILSFCCAFSISMFAKPKGYGNGEGKRAKGPNLRFPTALPFGFANTLFSSKPLSSRQQQRGATAGNSRGELLEQLYSVRSTLFGPPPQYPPTQMPSE